MIRQTIAAVMLLGVAAGRRGQSSDPVPIQRDGRWGYADTAGAIIIKPQFYKARKFVDGFAAVYVGVSAAPTVGLIDAHGARTTIPTLKKWGFIDQTGTLVIQPQFEMVGNFSEGLAAATYEIPFSDTDSWGYVDKKGKMVIKPQFSRADGFSEGLALVWTGGIRLTDPVVRSFVKMGYIDKTGQWIIHSSYWYYFYESPSAKMDRFTFCPESPRTAIRGPT